MKIRDVVGSVTNILQHEVQLSQKYHKKIFCYNREQGCESNYPYLIQVTGLYGGKKRKPGTDV